MRVEKIEGERALEKRLKELKKKNIRADQIIRKDKSYVVIYEDKKVLNEG